MKRIAALILALAAALALAAPAYADFHAVRQTETTVKEPEMTESLFTGIRGIVLSVNGDSILVRSENGEDILLYVDANTAVLDNSARKAAQLSAVREGETIVAWHDNAVMMSLPPQAYCIALLFHIEENQPLGQLIEAEAVEKTETGCRVLNQAGDLWFSVNGRLSIPVIGGGRTKASSLTAGSRIIVWYDIVLTSYPAQAGSDDVIALRNVYDGSVYARDGKASVNGERVNALLTGSGETFIDMKAAAKKLGFRTFWNENSQTLTVRKGEVFAAYQAGKSVYNLRGAAEEYAAPMLKDGALYGSADSFLYLGNYKIVK